MHYARSGAELPPIVFPTTTGEGELHRLRPRAVIHSRDDTTAPRRRNGTRSQGRPATPTPSPAPAWVPEGETVRIDRPFDQPLQLLPGRLQILEGARGGQEIRFFRIPGETPSITIGRDAGPPERHVRLAARTVSRLHARMQFEDGRWTITNLSLTNPLVLNGEELPAAAGSRLLDEGDRIEIGEVVLRFRER